ncbi:hypothetical protein EMPS_01404 [Entomortierella parvispora]|uniref:Uncharacterized protein n=1 Tax=Entomortierella parvispora TaxID=205924 RepID=A0A9P3H3I2_9FUNG|nr:hypothetical protein EMPS_01404 [Entomortierella parvispora]
MFTFATRSNNGSHNNAPTTTVSKSLTFTAYSLTSAVMMGSSVGLVILQNHQLLFLNGLLTFSFSSAPSTSEHSLSTTTTAATTSATEAIATAFMAGFWRFATFTVSAWIPLLVWFLSLLISALWTHQYFARSSPKASSDSSSSLLKTGRKVAAGGKSQKAFTPRMVILASHILFSFFWVILAAVQEVEEQRMRTSARGGRTQMQTPSQEQHHSTYRPYVPQTPSTSTTTTMMLSPEEQQALTLANAIDGSMIVYPLCIVWLSAVVLLGMATGLMVSSSAVLEHQAACMDDSANPVGAISNTAEQHQHDEKEASEKTRDGEELSSPASESTTTTTTTTTNTSLVPLVGLARFSWAQRASLFLLLQLLFSILMPFYQWMLSLDRAAPSSLPSNSFTASWLSTSSCMILFGSFLGMLMVALGRRFIPANPPTMPLFCLAHRHL